MHNVFLNENSDFEDHVNYSDYTQISKENFGYSFRRPQVVVCTMCESLSVKFRAPSRNDNGKSVVAAELITNRTKKFYPTMDKKLR